MHAVLPARATPARIRPTLRLIAVAALAAAAASPLAALAQAKGKAAPAAGSAADKGEMWEMTIKMDMQGFSMPAQTNQMCLGKEAKDEDLVPKNDDCKLVDSRRTGSTYRFTMKCGGREPMTAEGEFKYTPQGYDGRMKMTTKDGEMTQTIAARKLGECTGTVQAKAREAIAQGEAQKREACVAGIRSLNHVMFFGQSAMCEDKAAFCAEVTKLSASMSEPAGYTAGRSRSADLAGAFGACNQDFAAVTRSACAKGVQSRNFEFVASGACDDDVRRIGESSCKGRSFTGIEPSMRGLCSRYASVTRAAGGTASASASPPAAPPASRPQPAAQDPVQQGLDAVRKLLPF